ncbi:MAG: TonB-dependent receptor, partial [Ginsengibacter sp.]
MTRMKSIIPNLFLLLPFLIPASLFAQNKSAITGRIFMHNSKPAFVTVELKKQKKLTETDNNGNFKLMNVLPIQDTLVITSVESQVQLTAVHPLEGEVLNLGNIDLDFNLTRLQDIEVRGRIAHSYKSDYSFLGTKTQTTTIDIPQSISSITKELIVDRMDFTLKEAANDAAGVNNYSGYDDYSIRGFKAENASLINGLRGYNTTYTSPMLVNIERIEVVKGPSATLYGNCDPGGTINLVTKKPLAQHEGEITIGGGTWDHYRVTGDVTGPLNSNKTLLYRFNAGYDKTNSFRNQYFAKSFELAPSVSFISNEKIQLNVNFSLSHINTILDRGQPGFQNDYSLKSTPTTLIAAQPGDYLHETDYASNVLFSYKINNHINFNSGYLNYTTQQNTAEHGVQSYITPDSVNLYFTTWDYHTTTNTFTNYFTFRFNTGKFSHQLLAGYDYIKSKVELDQEYYEDQNLFPQGSGIAETFSLKNPRYISRDLKKYTISGYESQASDVEPSVYHTQGIYLQEQISINKWKLLIGLREELYEASGGEVDTTSEDEDEANVFLPRLGLVYELKPNLSLYATYNKGFDPFEATTSTQVFDEPFKPITSELYEAGAKAN